MKNNPEKNNMDAKTFKNDSDSIKQNNTRNTQNNQRKPYYSGNPHRYDDRVNYDCSNDYG